ncbi:HEAT repeat domain-containing protein [Pontimicrobium sp. SW4]|uniref:HEAT repeat domain-containing protein n=1 Tax=Pontimicrobium sp. SW4 TaxID=3153519 RepID=A0AAU7BQ06_9FLAO
MFEKLKYLLIELKLIQPSENDIYKWQHTNQVLKIEYALKHGNYKIREFAANALGEIGSHESVPYLLHAINDEIQNVSIAALNALDRIECEDELGKTVIKKRFNWLQKLKEKEEKRRKANSIKKYNIYRWERASKKSFDRVKEQLKKPMR